MKFRPVFVMGCPRSGTTLLASMLASSSGSFALPELHFLHDILKHTLIFGKDREAVAKLLKRSPYFLALGLGENDIELGQLIGSGEPVGVTERILERYIASYLDKNPGLWVEHSPQNFRDFDVLRHYFPTAKFLHVVRDGRAVFNSVKKPRWGPADVVNGAAWWARNVRECLMLEALFPSDIMRVRYEQLATQPEQALNEICQWLDFPYSSDMLACRGIVKPCYSRHHPLVGKPVDGAAVDKWKRELSRKEIGYFTHKNRNLLHQLGYLRTGPTQNPFSKPAEFLVKHLGRLAQRRNGKRFKRQLVTDVSEQR